MLRTFNKDTGRYENDPKKDYSQPVLSTADITILQDKLLKAEGKLIEIAKCTNVKKVKLILAE